MIFWLTVSATLSTALMGGIFFAFSSFVMPALGRIPPAMGIRAMQRINVDVFCRSFKVVFFGTPLLCLALLLVNLRSLDERAAVYCVTGSAIYLVGSLLATGIGNVPRNNALAKLDPEHPDPATLWRHFANGWTLWNHVRTFASLAAAAAFLAALVR